LQKTIFKSILSLELKIIIDLNFQNSQNDTKVATKLKIREIRELSGKLKIIRERAEKFTQFWNITNLTIKNTNSISSINNNCYITLLH